MPIFIPRLYARKVLHNYWITGGTRVSLQARRCGFEIVKDPVKQTTFVMKLITATTQLTRRGGVNIGIIMLQRAYCLRVCADQFIFFPQRKQLRTDNDTLCNNAMFEKYSGNGAHYLLRMHGPSW